MKLVAFCAREGIGLPGIRASAMSTMVIGKGALADWKVHLRGPALVLESPLGFNNAGPGVRTVYEIARTAVYLQWHLDEGDKLTDMANYTHPDPPPKPPEAKSAPTRPTYVAGKPVADPPRRPAATDDDVEEDDGDGDGLPSTGTKRAH